MCGKHASLNVLGFLNAFIELCIKNTCIGGGKEKCLLTKQMTGIYLLSSAHQELSAPPSKILQLLLGILSHCMSMPVWV